MDDDDYPALIIAIPLIAVLVGVLLIVTGNPPVDCFSYENRTVYVEALSENGKSLGKVPITAPVCIAKEITR